MEWIFKMIEPIIKGSETPEEAIKKVKDWAQFQHPRDGFIGIFATMFINEHWEELQKNKQKQ